MTHQLRCGFPAPPTLRGPGARIEGPQTGRQYPWARILFPIGRVARPCTDPSYARDREFWQRLPSRATPSGCPREPGSSRSSRVSPTPHVCSWASALGLWGAGDRVLSFPAHRRWGKMIWKEDDGSIHTIPDPTFGTDSQSIATLTCPGRPTSSPGSPPGMCGSGSSGNLSVATLPVECRASPDFAGHAASPAA
jgi:hypothetical protein